MALSYSEIAMDAKTNMRRMVTEKAKHNASHLELELAWFEELLTSRMDLFYGRDSKYKSLHDIPAPALDAKKSLYASFVDHYQLSFAEQIAILLSLVPHIRPQLLDIFLEEGRNMGFSEFGGVIGQRSGLFLPTGETLIFIVAGKNLDARFQLMDLFDPDHFFAKHGIIQLEPSPDGEPAMSGTINLSDEYLDYFTSGYIRKPDFNMNFPAKLITSPLEWDDLVLNQRTWDQIDEIRNWIKYGHVLLHEWELGDKLHRGYRTLFHGPSGTGKTATAALLGKVTDRDVYRVDLSMVISKYIGETEKNLSNIFDRAEHRRWILFFDESDALFGRRTEINSAHDRFANQEVSYLLQRIENFNGLVILASNMKGNIDDAFTRRFESIIHFPLPKAAERQKIWEKAFTKAKSLDEKIDFESIAEKYEVTGAIIKNVVHYSSLKALSRNSDQIMLADIEGGIRKELRKEGKMVA